MLIVYFDSQSIVHKEFEQEGCTVNAEYYKGVLDRLISRIRRVRPALYRTRDFFLLHDNAPAHSTVSDSKTSRNIEPPPIFARFVSPDYFLFPKVKLQLKGARFDTTEENQKAVTDQLNNIPTEDFSNAIKKLETRANLCITSNGSYFEQINRKNTRLLFLVFIALVRELLDRNVYSAPKINRM